MRLFKSKKELDSKSKHISVMYLSKAKTQLEDELSSNKRNSEDTRWTAEHDIKCLQNAIDYLEANIE